MVPHPGRSGTDALRDNVPAVTRGQRALAALALALAALLLPSSATAASGDVIRRLDIEIDIRPDGTLDVTETYDWDFGSRQGLGLTRELDARFDYEPEPGKVRVYEYGDFAASSPSQAPAGVWVHEDGAQVRVDIGAPDGSSDRRSGVQVYELSYTVEGALNAIRGQSGVPDQDELYWNATGHNWNVPIEAATVTVTGPTGVVDHACYQGPTGSTAECATLEAEGGRVTASASRLSSGSGMTIMAAYPPGTFGLIEPILEDEPTSPYSGDGAPAARVADAIWSNAVWLIPLALVLPIGFGVWRVRRGRDLHYADLPPGVFPAPGASPRVTQIGKAPVVAVRFTPPDQLRPAEVGALDDKNAAPKHITATIIDLAVRGHLQIHEAGTSWRGTHNDWLFVATPQNAPRDQLNRYEHTLLTGLFGARRQVKLSQLRNHFHRTMRSARRELAEEVDERRLFAGRLRASAGVRAVIPLIVVGFIVLNFLRVLMAAAAFSPTVFLVVVAALLLLALLVAAAVTRRARLQRTAAGRALHEQSRGFELYLSTAEAHQLRFEEGEDIFSRYLPYAIVYGVAERWARIFAQLEAQGVRVERPTWYVGTNTYGGGSFQHLGSALSSFSSTASSALSSTPGSSGSSGSRGGGGGFSGGGGGGGGGGGR